MGSEQGSTEWAIAIVATTIAEGSPTGRVSPAQVRWASEALVTHHQERGHDHVILPSGAWTLERLTAAEVLGFARQVVRSYFEEHGQKVVWDDTARAAEKEGGSR